MIVDAPCDVLRFHADADQVECDSRRAEREEARTKAEEKGFDTPFIPLVPVRTSETWVLFDEIAIRKAATNRDGKAPLKLPKRKQLEAVADPKAMLDDLVRTASGLTDRGWDKFHHRFTPFRIADCITDFSPLLQLPAFRAFDDDVKAFAQSWSSDE